MCYSQKLISPFGRARGKLRKHVSCLDFHFSIHVLQYFGTVLQNRLWMSRDRKTQTALISLIPGLRSFAVFSWISLLSCFPFFVLPC